jgi:3-deoxy-D-manno-octulosonic acid kinase
MPGARAIEGRATAYAITLDDGEWLVRHYRRGGAVARLLGDRYMRVRPPRAFHELTVSAIARSRGIPTPEVIAAVSYPSGLFTRCDIAVAFIPNALDLAAVLFGESSIDVDAETAKAAAVIRTSCERGLIHADLNLKNILLAPEGGYVIDLDRCRLAVPSSPAVRAMRRRFLRSLEKWETQTGKILPPRIRRMLVEAFRAG